MLVNDYNPYMSMRTLQPTRLLSVFLVLWLVACGRPATEMTRVEQILEIFENEPQTVLITAHRGGHLLVPENTLAAIDEAVEAGAHIVELDVRQTADGELIMMHDRRVDRTTTGTGAVDSLTWVEIRELPLTHQGVPTVHRTPTLREALLHARDRIMVDLDYKVGTFEAAQEVYDLIRELDMERQVLFFLYDHKEMPALHVLNPNIRIMPRARKIEDIREIVGWQLTDIIHIDESFAGMDELELMRRQGIRLWANTLGARDSAARVDPAAFGDFFRTLKFANIVQTDEPALLVNFLNKK